MLIMAEDDNESVTVFLVWPVVIYSCNESHENLYLNVVCDNGIHMWELFHSVAMVTMMTMITMMMMMTILRWALWREHCFCKVAT